MCCESPCKEFTLASCLGEIFIKAGLTAAEDLIWSLLDKSLGNVYEGIGTTGDEGLLTIDTSVLPDGLLNEHAGPFELSLRKAVEPFDQVKFKFGDVEYECVSIILKEFTPAIAAPVGEGAPEEIQDDHNTIQ